jgi:hypothetical protein
VIKILAFEHKMGTHPACSSDVLSRTLLGRAALALATWVVTSALVMTVAGVGARAGDVAITCTNPVSGATWQIRIDYDRSTVDSNPARISGTEIKWRDAKDGWNYTLDLKSGNLTVIIASATGGNFLYDRCKLEN